MNSAAHPEVVVITGASAGVGRAVAQRFARAGARLGLVAREPARLEAARREVESLGGQAVVHAGDVAAPETHERIAALVEEAFGPIDIWINNAMTSIGIKLNKLWPGFLDRFLVTRSFGKTDQPRDPDQPDNLFQPAPGDWAAHVPFDAESVEQSPQLYWSERRGLLLAGFAAAVIGLVVARAITGAPNRGVPFIRTSSWP